MRTTRLDSALSASASVPARPSAERTDSALDARRSSVGTSEGMARKVAPTPVSFRNTLTRKRPPFPDTYEKSTS